MAEQGRRFEAPQPGDARYARALIVLFSGRFDHFTGAEMRTLIDSDISLGEPLCGHDWRDMSNTDRGGSIEAGAMCVKCGLLGPGALAEGEKP